MFCTLCAHTQHISKHSRACHPVHICGSIVIFCAWAEAAWCGCAQLQHAITFCGQVTYARCVSSGSYHVGGFLYKYWFHALLAWSATHTSCMATCCVDIFFFLCCFNLMCACAATHSCLRCALHIMKGGLPSFVAATYVCYDWDSSARCQFQCVWNGRCMAMRIHLLWLTDAATTSFLSALCVWAVLFQTCWHVAMYTCASMCFCIVPIFVCSSCCQMPRCSHCVVGAFSSRVCAVIQHATHTTRTC